MAAHAPGCGMWRRLRAWQSIALEHRSPPHVARMGSPSPMPTCCGRWPCSRCVASGRSWSMPTPCWRCPSACWAPPSSTASCATLFTSILLQASGVDARRRRRVEARGPGASGAGGAAGWLIARCSPTPRRASPSFPAGKDKEEIQPTLRYLARHGIAAILDYAAEDDLEASEPNQAMEEKGKCRGRGF